MKTNHQARFVSLLVLVISMIVVTKSPAQVGQWSASGLSSASSYGGIITLAIAPSSPNILFAGDKNHIYKSTDGGASWTQVYFGTAAYSLAIDPTNPGVVYAGRYVSEVVKTINGGTSWVQLPSIGTSTHTAIAINPSNVSTVYVGVKDGWGVYKTTNGGAGWSNILTNNDVRFLAIDPTNTNIVYAGTKDYYTVFGGVLKSTNGGTSWTQVATHPQINAIAVDPRSSGVVYAATQGDGLYKTTDGGTTWIAANTGLAHPIVQSIAIDPTSSSILYVGTWEGGVYKSTNGGATWVTMNSGLTNTYVLPLVIDPSNPSVLYAGVQNGGVFKWQAASLPPAPTLSSPLNAATSQATTLTCIWSSSTGATKYHLQVSITSGFTTFVVNDSSLTGTLKSIGPLVNGTTYYWRVRSGNSAGWSSFSGSWSFTTVATLPVVSTSAATNVASTSATLNGNVNPNGSATTAYFEWGTNNALVTSSTTTSQAIGSGSASIAVTAPLTGLTPNTTYYYRVVGQNGAGIQRGAISTFTTQGAASAWTVQSSGVSVTLFSVKAISSNIAWACGSKGTVLRTTDGGTSWKATLPLLSSLECYNIDVKDANLAWVLAYDPAAVASFLFKTTNGGSSWTQQLTSNNPTTFYDDVRFYDASNGILLGDPEDGYFVIYTTTNGGDTWNRTASANIPAPLPGEYSFSNNMSVSGNNAWFSTGGSSSGLTRAFRSTDRGKTWTASPVINGLGVALVSTAFASETAGLILGYSGGIIRTTNGGIGWSTPISTGSSGLGSIVFASPTSAIFLGNQGQCSVSLDAGLTWSRRATPDTTGMNNLSFSSSADGWAVGNRGTIWRWGGGNLGGPPWVTTSMVVNISPTSATSSGVVNPNGSSTTAFFELGTSSALVSPTQTPSQSLGAGTNPVIVTATLSGLSPNTTYYVRAVAQNSTAAVKGSIASFTTTPLAGDQYEPNNTAAKATVIAYGFKSSGADLAATGDVDYYKFTANASDFVSIEALTDEASGLDVRISLHDADGNEVVATDMASIGTERILYGVNRAQTYFIRVLEWSDTSSFPNRSGATDEQSVMGNGLKSAKSGDRILTIGKTSAVAASAYTLSLSRGSPLAPLALGAGNGFNGFVPLRWLPPLSNSPAEYRIYRSTSAAGPFDLIGSSPREDYVDTNAVNGTLYYYGVRSVYAETNAESGPSNIDKATPRATGFKTASRFAYIKPTIDGKIRANEWIDAQSDNIVIKRTAASPPSITLSVKNDATTLYLAVEDSNATLSTYNRLVLAFDGDFNKTWDKGEPTDEGFLVIDDSAGVPIVRFFGVFGAYPNSTILDEVRNPKGILAQFSYESGSLQYEVAIDLGRVGPVSAVTGALGIYAAVVSDGINGEYPPQALLLAPLTFSDLILAKPSVAKLPGEYTPDLNSVLLLHLNEVAGAFALDASGNGNNGITLGGTSAVDGRFGKARLLSANGDQIDIAHSSSLNFGTGSYTLEAWINTLGLSDPGGHPFHKRGANGRGWFWLIQPGGRIDMSVYNNPALSGEQGISSLRTNRTISDGRWHHIASVVTPTSMTFFVDGVLDTAGSVSTQGSPDNTANLSIGLKSGQGSTSIFKGLIEEVRISNKARSRQEFNLQLPPINLSAAVGGTLINLQWLNGGGAVGLLRYRIYRGLDSTNVTFIDSTAALSYASSGLTAGTRYFFRVTALDSTGFESARSYAASAATSVPTLSPPTLSGPANNASGQSTTVTLTWTAVTGATGYHVQVSTNSTFTTPLVYEDTALTVTSKQMRDLAENAAYYWRARSRNAGGFGSWSSSFTFSTTNTKTVTSPGISFPSSPSSSTDYRLVSFPGASSISVTQVLSGSQNTDWRIFRENGGAIPNNLTELSSSSTFTVGEGYWLLTKGTFTYSRSTTMPQLSSDGSYTISVRNGWNIIGNPFDIPMAWSSVRQLNSITATLWTYTGSTGFQTTTILEPFRAYYCFLPLTSLKIRYVFPAMKIPEEPPPAIDWKLQVVLETSQTIDAENYVGIASTARDERDQLDQEEPPPLFEQPSLSIASPINNSRRVLLSADYRPSIGDGQAWRFEISNSQHLTGKIRVLGIESLPAELEIAIINAGGKGHIDLRKTREIPIPTTGSKTWLDLVIGTRSFVEQQESQLVPKSFELFQNYPNPFNPKTIISYQLPAPSARQTASGLGVEGSAVSFVTLKVFDPLGREVATLVNAEQPAGRYQVTFDAGNLTSGIYFYKLQASQVPGGQSSGFVDTKKLVLVK